jgi:hypothetical protein
VKFRDLERQIRHIENARDQRDRGPQRPEKTAGEDAERTPFFNEGVAQRQGVRVARERPHLRDRLPAHSFMREEHS